MGAYVGRRDWMERCKPAQRRIIAAALAEELAIESEHWMRCAIGINSKSDGTWQEHHHGHQWEMTAVHLAEKAAHWGRIALGDRDR